MKQPGKIKTMFGKTKTFLGRILILKNYDWGNGICGTPYKSYLIYNSNVELDRFI